MLHLISVSQVSDAFNLHASFNRQFLDANASPRWFLVDHLKVSLIHGVVVVHICDVDVALDHILQTTAGFFKDDREVLQCLNSLCIDVVRLASEFHRRVIGTDVSANIDCVGVDDGLREEWRFETFV